MEGVPTSALAEWKANKEEEAGGADFAGQGGQDRPRNVYNVISEADLHVALIQHKALMSQRDQPRPMPPPGMAMPGFPPNGMQPPFPGYVISHTISAMRSANPCYRFPPPGMGMPPPTLPHGAPPPEFQPYVVNLIIPETHG